MSESNSEKIRNDFKAGIFIFVTLGLAIAVLIILSGWDPFVSQTPYKARFSVDAGINGLAAGSNVKVGGLNRGTVTGVMPQFTTDEKGNEELKSIIVTFEIDSAIELYENAVVARYLPLLGGMAWLNFTSVGGPTPSAPNAKPLTPNAIVEARTAGGMLATLLGPANAERTTGVIKNVNEFSEFLTQIPQEWDQDIKPMLVNANTMVAELRTDYEGWAKRITIALARVDDASEKLDQAMDQVSPILTTAQTELNHVGDILDENSPKIASTMQNLVAMTDDGREVMNEVRVKTMTQIDELMQKGLSGLKTMDDALTRIDDELILRMPDISMMLSNLRQATSQLKLTALEIRRSPWKILYTPSTEVLTHENLYESARSYVMATNELEAAAQSFRSVFEMNPEALKQRPELQQEVEKYVMDALDRYKKAQERLFSEIVDQ
jgi:ABC-type transporter Mla subunit MlaD